MAHKRNAQEAFGKPKVPLSAFAAAKLARQSGQSSPAVSSDPEPPPGPDDVAAAVGAIPYNGHHSGTSTPNADVDNEVISAIPIKPPTTQLSSFIPRSGYVDRDDEETLYVTLRSNETITLVGEYEVSVPKGIATIYGAVLRLSSGQVRVFAPSTHALPMIQARQDITRVMLHSVNSSLRKLEELSPLFRNIWAKAAPKARSFALLGSTDDDPLQRSVTALDIDRETDTVLRTLSAKVSVEPRKPRIMAVGAKSSGKSTFNRVLCNHLLSWDRSKEILYLDLDPGQPEFGPPGQVSLVTVAAPVIGPPFAHVATRESIDYRLLRSHTISAMSFKDDSRHYKACALDLIRHVERQRPLVVNSCGWVSGLGATVLAELVPALEITDVVLLEPLDAEVVGSLQTSSTSLALYSIPRRAPKPSSRTPAESRAMQTMAYFHHRPRRDSIPRWSGKSIDKIRPWIVDYASDGAGVFAVMSYGQSPHPAFLAEVLNGSVVAIVTLDERASLFSGVKETVEQKAMSEVEKHLDRTPEGIPYVRSGDLGINRPLDPSTSQCIGLALIRGIDTEHKQFHLLTPLPESQIAELLRKRVVLVRGGFDPPEWAYLEDLFKDNESAASGPQEVERPWVSKKEMVGIEGAVWRLRHPPMPAALALNR